VFDFGKVDNMRFMQTCKCVLIGVMDIFSIRFNVFLAFEILNKNFRVFYWKLN